MKSISGTQKCFGFKVPHFGFLICGGLTLPKGTPSRCTLSIAISGLQ